MTRDVDGANVRKNEKKIKQISGKQIKKKRTSGGFWPEDKKNTQGEARKQGLANKYRTDSRTHKRKRMCVCVCVCGTGTRTNKSTRIRRRRFGRNRFEITKYIGKVYASGFWNIKNVCKRKGGEREMVRARCCQCDDLIRTSINQNYKALIILRAEKERKKTDTVQVDDSLEEGRRNQVRPEYRRVE